GPTFLDLGTTGGTTTPSTGSGSSATSGTSTISATTRLGGSLFGKINPTRQTPGVLDVFGPFAQAPSGPGITTTPGTRTTTGGRRGGMGGSPAGGSTQPGVPDVPASAISVDSDAITGGLGGRPTPPSTPLVRLRDVARIELGAQNYNQACTFDGKPSVGLAIFKLPDTNSLDVADRVKQKLEELKDRFPDGVDYQVAYDT